MSETISPYKVGFTSFGGDAIDSFIFYRLICILHHLEILSAIVEATQDSSLIFALKPSAVIQPRML